MSWPNISKYISFSKAVAFRSRVENRLLSAWVWAWFEEALLTHVLAANLGATFLQTVLYVLLLVAFVAPQASDEVV